MWVEISFLKAREIMFIPQIFICNNNMTFYLAFYAASPMLSILCTCVLSAVLCLVTQSYPALCNPMDCSHGDSPGKNTGVGSHALLQGIFLAQGSNLVSCTAGGLSCNFTHTMLMERTLTSLKVHNLKFHM